MYIIAGCEVEGVCKSIGETRIRNNNSKNCIINARSNEKIFDLETFEIKKQHTF
jgi:hypothetical protein